MFESAVYRPQVLAALRAGPLVLPGLLVGITEAELDFRPDPERLTIRETVPHLAYWDAVALARMERIVAVQDPEFETLDEPESFASSSLVDGLAAYVEGRARVVSFLESLRDAEWARTCIHRERGAATLGAVAATRVVHDSYHFGQVVRLREACQAQQRP